MEIFPYNLHYPYQKKKKLERTKKKKKKKKTAVLHNLRGQWVIESHKE